MKKKRWMVTLAIIIVVAILAGTVIIIENNKLREREAEREGKDELIQEWRNYLETVNDDETVFRLSDSTPFEWDEGYVVFGYYDLNQMEEAMGPKYSKVFSISPNDKAARLMGTDLSNHWIFFSNNEVVFEYHTFDITTGVNRIIHLTNDLLVTAKSYEDSDTINFDFVNMKEGD